MTNEQERAEFEAWAASIGFCVTGKYAETIDVLCAESAFKAGYQAGRAALQSQDREDAARYRWLRLQRSITDLACVTWNIGHDWVQMDGAELDEAIDHARRAEEDGE